MEKSRNVRPYAIEHVSRTTNLVLFFLLNNG